MLHLCQPIYRPDHEPIIVHIGFTHAALSLALNCRLQRAGFAFQLRATQKKPLTHGARPEPRASPHPPKDLGLLFRGSKRCSIFDTIFTCTKCTQANIVVSPPGRLNRATRGRRVGSPVAALAFGRLSQRSLSRFGLYYACTQEGGYMCNHLPRGTHLLLKLLRHFENRKYTTIKYRSQGVKQTRKTQNLHTQQSTCKRRQVSLLLLYAQHSSTDPARLYWKKHAHIQEE